MAAVTEDFALLGLLPTDNLERIKKARSVKALQYHPDRSGGDAGEFHKVNTAYKRIIALIGEPQLCAPCNGKGRTYISGLSRVCKGCTGIGTRQWKP